MAKQNLNRITELQNAIGLSPATMTSGGLEQVITIFLSLEMALEFAVPTKILTYDGPTSTFRSEGVMDVFVGVICESSLVFRTQSVVVVGNIVQLFTPCVPEIFNINLAHPKMA
eukprot:2391667-Amphidinium_carterae.1